MPVGLVNEIFLLKRFAVCAVSQGHHSIDLQQKSNRGVASQREFFNESNKLFSFAELDSLYLSFWVGQMSRDKQLSVKIYVAQKRVVSGPKSSIL